MDNQHHRPKGSLTPAPTAAEQARRNASEETALTGRLRRVDAGQDGLIKDLEALHDPDRATPLTAAGKDAMRDRIQHRFAELQTERETIHKQLASLARHTTRDNDPALIDTLPRLTVNLPGLPARLQQQLYHACDLEMIYRQHLNQVTINVTITSTTAEDITALLAEQTGETPENSAPRWDSLQRPPTR